MISGLVALVAVATALAPAPHSGTAHARNADLPPDVIALVAGEPIPRIAFDTLMAQARQAYATRRIPFPPTGSPQWVALKDQAVAFLVQRVIFRQKARALGIVVTDADVTARLTRVKQQYFGGSESRFREALRRQGLTEEQVREDFRDQLLAERLFAHVTAGVRVADAEVKAYFAKHRRKYDHPASRVIRHILVRTKAAAAAIYARLRRGARFAALARRHSRDVGSRRSGGRLTIRRGQTIPRFDRVAFSLRTGAVSRPIRTRFGWHIIKAVSRVRPGRKARLGEAAPKIRRELLQLKRNAAMQRYLEALKAEYAGKVVYQLGFEPGGVPA